MSSVRDLVVSIDFDDIDYSALTSVENAMDEIEQSLHSLDSVIGGAGQELHQFGSSGSTALEQIGDSANATENEIEQLGNNAADAMNEIQQETNQAETEIEQLGDSAGDAMNEIQQEANQAETEIEQLGNSGSQAMNEITSRAHGTSEAVKKTSFGFSKLRETIMHAAAAMGAFYAIDKVKDGISDIVKGGIEFNGMMETSQMAWETILRSQKKAVKTTEELLQLGAETPFEFEGLDKAGKLLTMAKLGGKNLTSNLTKVGDAVSAIGGGQDVLEGVSTALFQMSAKGKVQAEEMMQLAERGLPIWDILSDKMGKSTAELMDMSSKGKLLAKDVVPLLVDGMGERFSGAMEKQSKTYDGMMSTLSDNWKMMAGALMQPFFEQLRDKLPTVIDKIGTFTDAMQKSGSIMDGLKAVMPSEQFNRLNSVVEIAGDIFTDLKSIASDLWGALGLGGNTIDTIITAMGLLRDVVGFVADNTEILIPLLGGLFTSLLALNIINTVRNAWIAYQASAFAATVAQEGLNVALMSNPIGLVVAAIGLLVAGGIALYRNWDTVKAKTISLWNKLGEFKGIATLILGPLGFIIRAAVTMADNWDNTKGVWENVWNGIKIAASNAVNEVIGSINMMIGVINKIPGVSIPIVPKVHWGSVKAPSTGGAAMGEFRAAGAYATGLENVPYDDYPAYLHKGEAVLTAAQSNALRELGMLKSTNGGKPSLNIGGSGGQINGQITKGGEGRNYNFSPHIEIKVDGGNGDPKEIAKVAAAEAKKAMESFWIKMVSQFA